MGEGGRSTASLYHPHIRIHASQMIGGSEARRDSSADPASAARLCRSSWRLVLIVRLSALGSQWSLFWCAAILVLMRRQVSGDIHAWQRCYLQGGLVIPPRRSANRQLTPSGVVGGLMGKRVTSIFKIYRGNPIHISRTTKAKNCIFQGMERDGWKN